MKWIVTSQHSFNRGVKNGAYREYRIESNSERIISFDVVSSSAVDATFINPLGEEVAIDSILTTDSEEHMKFLLDVEGERRSVVVPLREISCSI